MEILDRINDPRFTTELARFNMEINLKPLLFECDCLSSLEGESRSCLKIV
ncbi:MAG: hypothetical protein IH947_00380 [Bacteroidetes bacterium]|nr:hypothetical protein [Bacteroidota bacterium]MCH8231417.1 hypothetical protein [Bacteroidota bacterium]